MRRKTFSRLAQTFCVSDDVLEVLEMITWMSGRASGKSTFFNAVTEGNAKVGSYPFTTIDPNHGIAHYRSACPCSRCDIEIRDASDSTANVP